MSSAAIHPVKTDRHEPAQSPLARWQAWRWVSLALCAATLVVLGLFGQRETDWSDFRDQLASGSVSSVVAQGAATDDQLSTDASGYSTVRLVYRDGLVRRFTEVRQYYGADAAGRGGDDSIQGSVASALAEIHLGVEVTYADFPNGTSSVGKYHLESAYAWPLLALAPLLTLFVIITGPEPRFATKWAWFWLMTGWAAPVAAIAYLLLADGHVPGRRRLHGGWAFIIAMVFLH